MKIVILSALYPPLVYGGAEKAAATLAEALARGGDVGAVISVHQGSQVTVEERNGVRVYRVPLDNSYWAYDAAQRPGRARRMLWHLRDLWNWRAARRVGAILDRERPDVVHSHAIVGLSVAVWREAKKRGIRLVHTTHDYYLLCMRSDMFPGGARCGGDCLQCKLGTAGRRFAARTLDEVVSVSDFVLRQHKARRLFEGVRSSVGYNISPPVRLKLGAHVPADEGELVFGYIGRIEAPKGIRVLLAATELLTRNNWRLRIAGAGVPALVERLKRHYPDPRIEWLGFIDPASFYASIHTTVLASIWEDPLPYVSIESLQYGKSLIAARSGGIPEVAALGRVVAIYPAEDVAALAAAMNGALGDVRRWREGGFANPNDFERFSELVVLEQHRARYRKADHGRS